MTRKRTSRTNNENGKKFKKNKLWKHVQIEIAQDMSQLAFEKNATKEK